MKTIRIAMLAVVSLFAYSQMAHARTSFFRTVSGVVCQPVDPALDKVGYNNYGVYNTSTTRLATVECPLNLEFSSAALQTLRSVRAIVYDRNTTSNIDCQLLVMVDNGDLDAAVPPIPFSSTGGGPGSGSQPIGAAPSGGARIDRFVVAQCNIPPQQSNSLSVITSFLVTSDTP